ncbi:MAG: hypothetical protein JRH20_23425 [Deltaproteobacteria bacterium]|nr:hypothetical protein [Deltaproteobacteria bacterium]
MRLPRFFREAAMRRRYRKMLSQLFEGDYRVSIARTVDEYQDAFRLVRTGYVYQGYLPMRSPELRIYNQHVLPESVVLIAKKGENVVGTMTVTLDSPAGLPLDKDYGDALTELRAGGEKLVEFGALAVLQPYQGSGVPTLMNMAAWWLAHNILGAERVVIGVNPRAVSWYRATMAFLPFGPLREHADLAAPVVGLSHDLFTFRSFCQKHFSQQLSSGLCAVEHFFDTLPDQVEAPPVASLEELNRWKLPREVFRELFVEQTAHLDDLDAQTRAHLAECRSPRTLEVSTAMAQAAPEQKLLRLRFDHTGPSQIITASKELSHVGNY